jgi:hypothetical protein
MGEKFVSGAFSNMQRAAAVGGRVAGELASGFGVSFDLSSAMQRGSRLERMAVDITNAGNRGGQGAFGRASQPKDLEARARDIGNKYAFDPTQVLSGLGQYQALTGDLGTGMAGLEGQARLAKAFNVDLDKMVASAGQVGAAIGEVGEGKEFETVAQKAAAVEDVLRTLTAQGQEGAIEIGNIATQAAKLKAAGGRFEGSTAESIKRMGALAQLSMQLGGSATATQAATSVMGFANTLATPARRAQFKEMGVDIDSATQKGAFADPFEIIKRSLKATGGETESMKKLFGNVVGERAVLALTTTYNKAGGGEKGLAAVDEQFKRFSGTVTDAQINENLGRALNTTEAKAQLFQNRLDQIAASLAGKVLPAFEKMAPSVEKVVTALAGMIAWGAENPGTLIVGAIVGSITKAGVGIVVGEALKALIAKSAAGGIGGGGGGAGKVLGAVGAIGAIGALGYAGYQSLKTSFDNAGAETTGAANTMSALTNAGSIARMAARGDISKEDALKQLESTYAAGSKMVRLGEQDMGWGSAINAAINPFSDTTSADVAVSQQVNQGVDGKSALPALKEDLAGVKAAIDALKAQMAADASKTKTVRIEGGIPGGAPAPNGAGRVDQ